MFISLLIKTKSLRITSTVEMMHNDSMHNDSIERRTSAEIHRNFSIEKLPNLINVKAHSETY